MTNNFVKTFTALVICGLLLITSHPVVLAQDGVWPRIPTDQEIDEAIARFIKEESVDKLITNCSQISDYTEKQLCLAENSFRFILSDESINKKEVTETNVIKMHYPSVTDPLLGNAVVLLYTTKNWIVHKDGRKYELLRYDTAILQYGTKYGQGEANWWFNTANWWDYDHTHLDQSLPPRAIRDTKVELLFRERDPRGYYGWERGFKGEQISSENLPPEVSLSFSPEYPTPNDTIFLTANASDPDGDSLTYTWSLDEKRISPTTNQVRMSNLEAGEYCITVQVSDGKGGLADDLVFIKVQHNLVFSDLRTGKPTYDFNETVRVIFSLKNWGEEPLDYYVEYRILDPSKKEVYYSRGTNHNIQPGESQDFKSEKYVIPDNALMGSYEIKAKCICKSGNDERNGYFNVGNNVIDISYRLGYEMPFTEENPIPLRVKFKVKEDSGIIGIRSIQILSEDPEIFYWDMNENPKGLIAFEKSGVKEATFDFDRLISKNLKDLLPITGEKTVSFVAKIGVLALSGYASDVEQEYEIEVPFKVIIKAAFTVCAVDESQRPDGEKIIPWLNGIPLSIDKSCLNPVKGFDGSTIRIFDRTRVYLRDLSGAAFSIGDYGGGDTIFWEVILSQANSKTLELYGMSNSGILAEVKMIAHEKGEEKSLDFLFEQTSKNVSGQLGIFMEILEAEEIGGEKYRRAVIKLRSILGVSIPENGDIVIRNYEGSPEIFLPDGSTMDLPPGHETVMDSYGYFSAPKTFDTSTVLDTTGPGPLPSGGETTQILGDYGDNNQDSILPWAAAAGGFFAVVTGALILKAQKKTQKNIHRGTKTPDARQTNTNRKPDLVTSSDVKKAGTSSATRQKIDQRTSASSSAECLKCGNAISPTSRFCLSCGAEIKSTQDRHACPKCGQPVRVGASFCKNCGKRVG